MDCTKPILVDTVEAYPDLKLLFSFAEIIINLLNLYISQNMASMRQILLTICENIELDTLFTSIDCNVFINYLQNFISADFTFTNYQQFIHEFKFYVETTEENVLTFNSTDIRKIQDFIYKNYGDDVSISYVSELFNLSPSYLSKLFHEKTGQKYIDFVTQVRIEKAKQIIIENTSATVKQVAEAVGYSSVRHFSKTFQKYTGKLPSDFRKID